MLQVATAGLTDGGKVFENLRNLATDVALYHLHGFRHEWNLSRKVHGIVDLDGLGIGADGLRGLVGMDYSFICHGMLDQFFQDCIYQVNV